MAWASACHTVGPTYCGAVPSTWNVLVPSRNLSPSLESPLSCAVLGHLPSAAIYKHLITR